MYCHLFTAYVLLLFSVSKWLYLKLKQRGHKILRDRCFTWCENKHRVGDDLMHNCIEICMASLAKEAINAKLQVDYYEPKRNTSSSHPSPSSSQSFFSSWPKQGPWCFVRSSSESTCYDFSVSEWLNLKLNPRQAEDFRQTCRKWCENKRYTGMENCVRLCIKGMAEDAGLPYELKRIAASSHPSPSSISFFLFQLT